MKATKMILRELDLVGFTPKVFFQEKNKYKSVLGGILTLLIFTLIVLASISFGQDIYLRADPSILLNKNFIEPMRNMTQETVIGYRLFYTGGIRIPDLDKLVDIFVLHSQFDPKLSSAFLTRYETIKCSQADVYRYNYLNITSLVGNPDDYYCLPNNVSLALKGKYGAPINNHMHLRIAICQNTTQNGNRCYQDSVIRQKMASFFVSFLYKDSYIDGKDFSDPVKYYLTSNTIRSSSYNFRQDAYLYKDVEFKTDAGLIIPDENTEKHVQLDTISTGSTADAGTTIFTNVIIGLSNIKDVYSRKYVKIQDVSAQVGGLIKFFLIFIEFLLSFYSYVPFLESLYDSLFNFELINPKRQENNRNNNVNRSEVENVIPNIKSIKFRANFEVENNHIALPKVERKLNFTPRKHSLGETLFRCCRVRKTSPKYCYLAKISNHYETRYDLAKIITNDNKLSFLYDYTFNKTEQEIINLYSISSFYEQSEGQVNIEPGIEEPNISSSMIFDKLKIPRGFLQKKD